MDLSLFIANRLRKLMAERKLAPARLAEQSEVSPSTVSRLLGGKCGNVRVGTLEKLCGGLEVGVWEFWRGEEGRENPRIPVNKRDYRENTGSEKPGKR